jgi:chromosome segregation protein
MFFKRIEMVGFKSFATKTTVEFLPGTTVIVGPNGCGKSNILDAIKWVLGEQAASQMRGKRMSDVIFAGSASFKALGIAQVTLTIDNCRRILPLDFDEVQVTRRLFRTGESEYLINKTPARLRDVHNLFLGTGIGKAAYSIMEQGRVDDIISAKPIERRVLIEEAAGISKFKARKVEALRKLERTDIDLARLGDLLAEVDRQVGSLKRQASKAERYKALFEAGRRAEQELVLLRSRDLRSRLESFDNDLRGLNDRLSGLRAQLAGKSVAEEQARDREIELGDRLADENQALFDLKSNLSECDAHITRINDKIAAHRQRVGQIHGELKELEVRGQEMALRLEEARQRREQARQAQQEHHQRHEELRRQYGLLQENVREQSRCIERLNHELNALRETLSRADNEVRTAEALIENQDRSRRETESLLASLEQTRADMIGRCEALRAALNEKNAAIENGQAEIEQLRGDQARRQETLAGRIGELEQARKDLHQGRARLDALNEMKAGYEGFYQGVREVMLAADGGQMRGIRGVVANLIRAKSEHELAIEVALAAHLQDIVTDRAEDAKAAIEFLKSAGRGRATFLPLDRLQVTPLHDRPRQILGRDGVLGIASQLVEFDPADRTAVEHLLGQTIVVRDLDVGLALQGEGFRARYVSLDGQLIHPAGSMTGGRIQTTGLMMREREIRDLSARVESLERQQTDLRKRIEALQEELQKGHQRIERRQGFLDEMRLERAGLQKDVESAQSGIGDLDGRLAERRTQLERIGNEVADRRSEIDRWRQERDRAAGALAEAESRLSGEREAAASSGEDIMSLGTSVAEARADAEKARERAEDARQQIESVERDADSGARQRQSREQEIESLAAEDAALADQIERIRKEADQHRIDYDELARRLSRDQAEREELLTTIKQLAGEVETLTRDERVLDNQARQLELEKAELHAGLESLSEQCVERHEMTLDALAEAIGEVDKDPRALHVEVADLRDKLARIGPVNMAALGEYEEQRGRLEFLQGQHGDLTSAKEQLESTIERLDDATRQRFHDSFEAVRAHFIEMFRKLFNGGKADLILDAPEGVDPLLDGGIEIMAQPPGKKLQNISLLSGGEKAMTAISLLFALFLNKPSPFCVLDEIDAPLDDANVNRFRNAVGDFKGATQFVLITHNKLTMELADALYGVTMEESGVSKVVSVRFDQAEQLVDAAS